MKFNIFHDVFIKASAKRVFQVITSPSELEKWWPLRCSGSPVQGAEYNFYFGEPYDWYGEVSEIEPNEKFYIKMTKSDDDWNPTHFGFELIPKGTEGTWLEFSHCNWQKDNRHFRHSSFCWAVLLNSLKKYIEQGIVIPFDERN